MKVYLITRKQYALHSSNIVGADYGAGDSNALYLRYFKAYRTRKDARGEVKRLNEIGYGELEIIPFEAVTKHKADARKSETWK